MLKVAIYGRNLPDLRRILGNYPVQVVRQRPDLVISYGGDGAFLGAERDCPGVPKLPLRDRRCNPKCPQHAEEQVIEELLAGRLNETTLMKLRAVARRQKFLAVNDVVIHNQVMTSAVRYRISLDDELYANRVVGDGLVAATPFGSTGYYRSITRSLFKLGIGLAFNNSTEPTDHLVIAEDTTIRVEILRGPAVVGTDNAAERILLKLGDVVTISKSREVARVLGIEAFRCPACARLRQANPDAV